MDRGLDRDGATDDPAALRRRLAAAEHRASQLARQLAAERAAHRRDTAASATAPRRTEALAEELRQSEARYRFLAEAIPQLVWTTGPDGAQDYVNERWREYTGLTGDNTVGDGWAQIIHPDDLPRTLVLWRESLRTGAPYDVQYRLRRADGAYRWFLGRALPLRDARGAVLKWFGTCTDIDDQKRAAAQLDALIDGCPLGIALLDTRGVYQRVNAALATINGRPVAAHLGRSVREVLPARDADVLEPILLRVVETGEPVVNVEVRSEARDRPGGEVHTLCSFSPVRVGEHVVGVSAMVVEITERKRGEIALELLARTSEALAASLDYRAAFAAVARVAVPDFADGCLVHVRPPTGGPVELVAVAHVDPEVEAALREIEARYPLPPETPWGHPHVVRTGDPEVLPSFDVAVRDVPARDAAHAALLARIRHAGGTCVPLNIGGETAGAMTFLLRSAKVDGPANTAAAGFRAGDILLAQEIARRAAVAYEHARLFDIAQRERVRAEEANRAKDEFLATVSHELRTPLTAMLGWTRMLSTGALPDDKRPRALATIERNAQAQARLIEDLLDISRIITGKLRLRIATVAPIPMIEAAIEAVRPAAEGRGVQLTAQLDPDAGPVRGDPDRIQQVVWNLLANAVKFTPAGGRVTVQLRRAGAQVEIQVTDTGQGIDPGFLPLVFERFRQADASLTRRHGGLGLGLAICRHLVELHGGSITAQSEGTGHGATFTVRLPVAPLALPTGVEVDGAAPPAAGSAEGVAPTSPVGGGRDAFLHERDAIEPVPPRVADDAPSLAGLSVLVVDDEQDTRELLAALLEESHARVRTAGSADEALAALTAEPPDVLVSDIGMPGEDGYSLIQRVRALPPERGGAVPAVALTAYTRPEDRARALRAGFTTHVPKPVEPTALVVVIAHSAGITAGSRAPA